MPPYSRLSDEGPVKRLLNRGKRRLQDALVIAVDICITVAGTSYQYLWGGPPKQSGIVTQRKSFQVSTKYADCLLSYGNCTVDFLHLYRPMCDDRQNCGEKSSD
jgi:hypothetical protein